MHIDLEASNRVSRLAIEPLKKADLEVPGQAQQIHVLVETENAQPLCPSAVEEGLTLCLLPPHGGRSDAIHCSISQVTTQPTFHAHLFLTCQLGLPASLKDANLTTTGRTIALKYIQVFQLLIYFVKSPC